MSTRMNLGLWKMKKKEGTKKQLLDELASLRLKISKLEASRSKWRTQATELRKFRERFAMLSVATKDAIHDWDLVKDQLWCNEGMQKTLGVGEIIEDPWSWWKETVHPDDRRRMVASMERLLKSDRAFGANEYRILAADGKPIHINHRIYVVRDRKGKPVRIMGAATDISERKLAEETLRRLCDRGIGLLESQPDAHIGRLHVNQQLGHLIHMALPAVL